MWLKNRISLLGILLSVVPAVCNSGCGGSSAVQPPPLPPAPASQPLSITTTSLPNGTVNVPYSVTLQSKGGAPPVAWSLNTALPPGLALSSNGTISGTATTPGSSCFIVTAADSSTPPQQPGQDLCIGINSADASHNALLKGHYAFRVSGLEPAREPGTYPALYATAGSFVADGLGNVTSGVSDTNVQFFDLSPGMVTANQPFTGTYALGSDNRGTISMNSSGGTTLTLAFSIGSISSDEVTTRGRIINFSRNGSIAIASGEFELQDSTAFSTSAISGSYAFDLSGGNVSQGPLGAAGVFTADGGGNVPSGNADIYQASIFHSDQLLAGTYGLPLNSTTGRGTETLTIAGTTFDMAFYIVSANKLFIVSAEPTLNPGVFVALALRQSLGQFNNGSLNGTSVFTKESAGGADITAGLATFDGAGTMTVLEDRNDGGTVTLASTSTATYNVSSSGRVAVSAGGSTVSVLYLVSAGKGFSLNTDSRTGFFEPQTIGPFTDSSINGSFFFGDLPRLGALSSLTSGLATLSAGTINQTRDIDQGKGSLLYDQTSVDTYTVSSNGRATIGSGNEVIYIVSPTKFVVIDVNPADALPTLKAAEL